MKQSEILFKIFVKYLKSIYSDENSIKSYIESATIYLREGVWLGVAHTDGFLASRPAGRE